MVVVVMVVVMVVDVDLVHRLPLRVPLRRHWVLGPLVLLVLLLLLLLLLKPTYILNSHEFTSSTKLIKHGDFLLL